MGGIKKRTELENGLAIYNGKGNGFRVERNYYTQLVLNPEQTAGAIVKYATIDKDGATGKFFNHVSEILGRKQHKGITKPGPAKLCRAGIERRYSPKPQFVRPTPHT